ncbi:MAG: peptide-methionine (S)-S-oxide reductase MsrA [Chthoniobacterales bacterium]
MKKWEDSRQATNPDVQANNPRGVEYSTSNRTPTNMNMNKTWIVIFTLIGLAAPLGFAQEKPAAGAKTAIFAGGCFWCMQEPFDHAKGIVKTEVGYTGGEKADANYNAVSAHKTQHREAIEVTYDPAVTTYEQLLDVYWRNVNPTQTNGQFADHGLSYQTAIYFANEDEKKIAEASKDALGRSGKFDKPIAVEILPVKPFYPAEDYHQKYYQTNPAAYEAYHVGSGRVSYLAKVWGDEKK